jgi:DNA-binding MarR family transcriptional regulator
VRGSTSRDQPNRISPASASTVELRELRQLLSETEQRMTHRLSDLLATEGTSVAQWRVLVLLAAGPAQPMSELARHMLLPSPSATRVIDGMVLDQLVYRTVDEHDRRRVLVHVTPAGRARYRRLADRIENAADAILTPGDVACLRRLAELVGAER